MANQSTRLRPSQVRTDTDAFAALQAITAYAPANTAYTVAKISASQASLASAQQVEAQAIAAAAAARDDAVAREREFHDLMQGAKSQVVAQFGPDSNEAQALGLKKKSEYRRPTRRTKPSGGQS